MKKSLVITILFIIIFLSACSKSPIIEPILDQTGSSDTKSNDSCSLNYTGDKSCAADTGEIDLIKNTGDVSLIKSTGAISLIKKDSKGFTITSSAFQNKGKIPVQHSCYGKNINPPFEIIGAPKLTQSFAMIVYDPDTQSGDWIHWMIWNISINTQTIDEGKSPLLAVIGKNSRGKAEYRGPCVVSGTHRYFFKLYAMDTNYGNFPNKMMTIKQFEEITSTHILGTAEIYGTYSK
ncbi:MAG: YbhB/YbcL family Raf kinase inhibitor-like protein [Candidatus Absconditicoccaceae bacterium]